MDEQENLRGVRGNRRVFQHRSDAGSDYMDIFCLHGRLGNSRLYYLCNYHAGLSRADEKEPVPSCRGAQQFCRPRGFFAYAWAKGWCMPECCTSSDCTFSDEWSIQENSTKKLKLKAKKFVCFFREMVYNIVSSRFFTGRPTAQEPQG